jgi:hypothetical protein
MPTNDTQKQVRARRRLERVLIAFYLLAALGRVGVYVAVPSMYTNMLLLQSALTDRYPQVATLVLVGLFLWIAVVIVGFLRYWRLPFWLPLEL